MQLAQAIGVTKSTICKYENGTFLPTLDVLLKIANKLKTSVMYLLIDVAILEKGEYSVIIGRIANKLPQINAYSGYLNVEKEVDRQLEKQKNGIVV